jgi:hypothetical protein
MTKYNTEFYAQRHEHTVYSARTVLSILLGILPPVRSAVDLGCGVGTWLSVLRDLGVGETLGMDGPWVNKALLAIPPDSFQTADVSQPVRSTRRYDLAISLEVAEHVPAAQAPTFVRSLTGLADFVLFSAAIPLQGGKTHVNEQWPDYWAALFGAEGYAGLDVIRRRVWNDTGILFPYKQNSMLFVRHERVAELRLPAHELTAAEPPLALVHPDCYLPKLHRAYSLSGSWTIFRRGLKTAIKRRLGLARQ